MTVDRAVLTEEMKKIIEESNQEMQKKIEELLKAEGDPLKVQLEIFRAWERIKSQKVPKVKALAEKYGVPFQDWRYEDEQPGGLLLNQGAPRPGPRRYNSRRYANTSVEKTARHVKDRG